LSLEAKDLLSSAIVSPLYGLRLISVSSLLMTTLMYLGEWEKAEEPCAQVVVIYLLVYPFHHPLTGLQLLTLGKIQWNALKSKTPPFSSFCCHCY